jgi:hypothetical protein
MKRPNVFAYQPNNEMASWQRIQLPDEWVNDLTPPMGNMRFLMLTLDNPKLRVIYNQTDRPFNFF